MYSIDILEAIMNDTTRQRYALLKLFTNNPNRIYTRQSIMEAMGNVPYHSILCPGGLGNNNPFINPGDSRKVPTTLRDRLADLVGAGMIEMKQSGKEAAFYQLRKDFGKNLFESQVAREMDVEYLKRMESIFDKYSELPISGFLGILTEKASRRLDSEHGDIEDFVVADLETPFVKDEQFRSRVEGLFYAINDKLCLPEIRYFGSYYSNKAPQEKIIKDFMPYVLKQSRGQWYLVGKCKDDKEFRAIPVNRITGEITPDEDKLFIREKFNPVEYWDGCAGITRFGKPLDISFDVKNGPIYNNIDYIRMIPIVKGHQTVNFKGDWMNVKLNKVYLGPELVRIIRSFGRDNINNICPSWLEEDLWESGRREDIRFGLAFKSLSELGKWKKHAASSLQLRHGGENALATLVVSKTPTRQGFYRVTIKQVLVSSRLYFFVNEVIREYGRERFRMRNKAILK